jgi:murein DD-endopeptidase MepM/ murein hydrolase activator NlpD
MAGIEDVKLQIGIDYEGLEEAGKKGAEVLGQALAKGVKEETFDAAKDKDDKELEALGRKEQLLARIKQAAESANKIGTDEVKLLEKKIQATQERAKVEEKARKGRVEDDEEGWDPNGSRKPYRRGSGFIGRYLPHLVSGGVNAYSGYLQGGGTTSAGIGVAADIAQMGAMFTPWAIPVSQALRLAQMKEASQERWADVRMNLFKEVGDTGRQAFHDVTWRQFDDEMSPVKYGLNDEETAQLIRGLGKGTGNIKGGQLHTMMRLQGLMGLGSEGIGLLSGLERAGVDTSKQEIDAIGAAIGVAAATGLERGRLGESFQAMTKAAQSIVHGQADLKSIAETQAFIGLMGPQYKGDTAAHGVAESALKTLAGGQGSGFSDFMSLRAAGFGKGLSYSEATLKRARGLDAAGGVTSDDIVKQWADQPYFRTRWKDGNARTRADVSREVAELAGLNQGTVYDILAAYYGGKMGVAKSVEAKALEGIEMLRSTLGPEDDMEVRRQRFRTELEKQREWFGKGPSAWFDPFDLFGQGEYVPPTLEETGGTATEGYMPGGVPERGSTTKPIAPRRRGRHYTTEEIKALGGSSSSGTSTSHTTGAYGFDISAGQDFHKTGAFGSVAEIEDRLGNGTVHNGYDSKRPAFMPGGRYPTKAEAAELKKQGKFRHHAGRDLYYPPGTPIYAPEGGVICEKGKSGVHTSDGGGKKIGKVHLNDEELYGYVIGLDSDSGYRYRFMHLQKGSLTSKGKGDRIEAGELIGRVVDHPTFASSNAHLHLEAYKLSKGKDGKVTGKKRVDPLSSDAINVEEFNTMSGTGGAPGGGGDAGSLPTGATGQQGALQGGGKQSTVAVVVRVEDARVSITQVAAHQRSHGAPGQQVLITRPV